MKFFAISKDYLFVWKKKFTQRVKQSRTYTRRSSIGWFTSQVSAAAGAGPIPSQEQELPLGLPCWCKVPRPGVSFCCFHRLLARTWMGSGAAETGAHPMNCVGCLYCRQQLYVLCYSASPLKIKFIIKTTETENYNLKKPYPLNIQMNIKQITPLSQMLPPP